jgi:hypothetical protein
MITVYARENVDEFPTGDTVDVTPIGVLIISETLTIADADQHEKCSNIVNTLAIYAPGSWDKVDRDESSMQLLSFLGEHELTEAWMKYVSSEDEDDEEKDE